MEYKFKLANFEGPLDLLLHLIEKHKIDIYDIPIVDITTQYMSYLEAWNHFDIHYSSEFLLMAATLLHIKSRMLLPNKKEESIEDEEDPRDELVRRLVEFKQIKELAKVVEKRQEHESYFFSRPDALSEIGTKAIYNLSDIPLYDIYYEAIHRLTEKEEESVQVVVTKEIYSVEKATQKIMLALRYKEVIPFKDYLFTCTTKDELVNTFLAILELLKTQILSLKEDDSKEFSLVRGKEYDT